MGEVRQEETPNVSLKRKITLFDGITLIVGNIVGSGIFITPTGVYQATNSVGFSLVVWFSAGIFSTLGALCVAELGTSITRSGGEYAYILTAFGPLTGFLFLWVAVFIIIPGGNAIMAITFAKYATKPFFPDCKPPEEAILILAGLSITLLTAINCLESQWAIILQKVFTIGKLAALILIIITGTVHIAQGHLSNLEHPFDINLREGNLLLAIYASLYSYEGWSALNTVTEELKNPKRYSRARPDDGPEEIKRVKYES